MTKKDKKYIEKIRVIAEADIHCGNKEKLEALMPTLIKREEHEDCEGIKQALAEAAIKSTESI